MDVKRRRLLAKLGSSRQHKFGFPTASSIKRFVTAKAYIAMVDRPTE